MAKGRNSKLLEVKLEGFDHPILSMRGVKAALRRAGRRTATRMRKRAKKRKEFQNTGQLVSSLKARMKRGGFVPYVTIMFTGVRRDSDDHKRRRPMRNIAIGFFLAARQLDPFAFTDIDQAFFLEDLKRQIAREIEKDEEQKIAIK